MQIIIGFTTKTGKVMPGLFCRHFKHCGIFIAGKRNKYLLIHKVKNGIQTLVLSKRDIEILKQHGWIFIGTKLPNSYSLFIIPYSFTCVSLVKRILNMHDPFILTPDALYKTIARKGGLF
jgi:hypothetical protein